jgi:phospholipid/cholesterol/gamma-HCH transport system permease protein
MFRRFAIKIGEAGLAFVDTLRVIAQGKIDWPETLRLIDAGGIRSLPVVTLSSTFIGMAISVQLAQEIVSRYGAGSLVGGFIALSMVRELGPIFIAVIMVGSIGAATTAEIASMKVEDQIDALRVFRISPLEYLVLPRIIASAVSGPVLTVIGTFLAILAGQLFTELIVSIPAETFWNSVKFGIDIQDIADMLLKSLVFSIAIVLIAAYNGFTVRGSSGAVGINTTRTVVWSLLAIFILNYFMTALFFQIKQ